MPSPFDRVMTYETAVDRLGEDVPEVAVAFDREIEWWRGDEPPPHVVYGNVLVPYLVEVLESHDGLRSRRAFDFVERLASSADRRLEELVAYTICEALMGHAELLRYAKDQVMGPHTRRLCEDAQLFWARAAEHD